MISALYNVFAVVNSGNGNMFSHDRLLHPSTQRGLYPYCPFGRSLRRPQLIDDPGTDVGCLVDNVINDYRRIHIHPDDL